MIKYKGYKYKVRDTCPLLYTLVFYPLYNPSNFNIQIPMEIPKIYFKLSGITPDRFFDMDGNIEYIILHNYQGGKRKLYNAIPTKKDIKLYSKIEVMAKMTLKNHGGYPLIIPFNIIDFNETV